MTNEIRPMVADVLDGASVLAAQRIAGELPEAARLAVVT